MPTLAPCWRMGAKPDAHCLFTFWAINKRNLGWLALNPIYPSHKSTSLTSLSTPKVLYGNSVGLWFRLRVSDVWGLMGDLNALQTSMVRGGCVSYEAEREETIPKKEKQQ